jgi:phenylacetic acid degradation operon negative regulatory protein
MERPYQGFLLRIRQELAEAEALDDRESFRRRFLLTHDFRRFPFSDPDLPDALLPSDWVGTTVREAFLEYNRELRRRAERFYRTIAGNDTIVDNGDRSMEDTSAAALPRVGAGEAD